MDSQDETFFSNQFEKLNMGCGPNLYLDISKPAQSISPGTNSSCPSSSSATSGNTPNESTFGATRFPFPPIQYRDTNDGDGYGDFFVGGNDYIPQIQTDNTTAGGGGGGGGAAAFYSTAQLYPTSSTLQTPTVNDAHNRTIFYNSWLLEQQQRNLETLASYENGKTKRRLQEQQLQQQQSQQQQQQFPTLTMPYNNTTSNDFNPTLTNQTNDEISKSLQMYAILSTHNPGNEIQKKTHPSLLDVVMTDFAQNGYVSDEMNAYSRNHALTTASQNRLLSQYNNNHNNSINNQQQIETTAAQLQAAQLLHTQLTLNLNEMRNNFWKLLPTSQQTQATAAAGAQPTMNKTPGFKPEYNQNTQYHKKLAQKRMQLGKKDKHTVNKHCVFCENNNEPEAVVKSHAVRDSFGRVLCPKLRTYICPICKASGDMAHTIKYCPKKPIITMEDALKAELRFTKNMFNKSTQQQTQQNE